MTDLWQQTRDANRRLAEPLAVRVRPRTLDQFVGQTHFLGPGKLLRRMLAADRLTSVIFYGPPGTGKTTLAELIAHHTHRAFVQANAAAVGVREVREVLDNARKRLELDGSRTIFFLDEIHRFNRAQQDVLLGDVERGIVILIGATTENPFFAINSPLVSRSQIFEFQPLSSEDVKLILNRAIQDPEQGYGKLPLRVTEEALAHWAKTSDGDARRALTALEIAVLSTASGKGSGVWGRGSGEEKKDEMANGEGRMANRNTDAPSTIRPSPSALPQVSSLTPHAFSSPDPRPQAPDPITISLDTAEQSIQRKAVVYDATGDQHYDAASALIKSMRGSDPDAAIYWLARMLVAGEDPRFIARRVAILASEDIGNADPRAIQVAAAAYTITERIGMPECQLTLAQAVIYMATAPKSNASTLAIGAAMKDAKEGRTIPVPRHLRDGHYAGAKRLGNAQGYQYAHDSPTGYVDQDYLGVEKTYYQPTERGYEQRIGQYLEWIRQQKVPPPAEPPPEANP